MATTRIKRISTKTGLLLGFCCLLFCSNANAQDKSSRTCFDISKVGYLQFLSRGTESAFMLKQDQLSGNWQKLNFKQGIQFEGSVPSRYVMKTLVLRFRLCNTADTAQSIWFFPGFFYTQVQLYQQDSIGLQPLPNIIPKGRNNVGYRKITLQPHDTVMIYAEMRFLRTYINTMRPRLIHMNRIGTALTDSRAIHDVSNMVTFLFCGLLLMMILFSMTTFLQGGSLEFFYYSAYAFFVGGMLLTKGLYDFTPSPNAYFFESYLDFIMQGIGHLFYLLFIQRFLATRRKHPFLWHFYNFGVACIVLSLLVFSYLHYFTDNYWAEYAVENITKIFLLVMTFIFLIYSLRQWKSKLFRYIFWGHLFLFICALLSLTTVMIDGRFLPGILGSALFYYEMGLFLELVFFFAALNHKNRRVLIEQTRERERLKTENQMKEYEKELAVYKAQQEERQRISADMHDELGAGMTAIRLMSEIARNKMKESTPVEIEKISNSADEVLNKMNAIIWSMNIGNDSLDNLVSYIRSYAIEYFESTPVDCRVITPDQIPHTELTGDKRRNVFLCVKETLNNALKHAQATEIIIRFEIGATLVITVTDNGVGIDLQKLRRFGNGLKNIARRMESIGGTFEIVNEGGTVTRLTLPLEA